MSVLRSLKSDLLDRRLLPILLALGVAVAGAVAYTVLAGGGSSASPVAASAPTPAPVSQSSTLAVSQAPANPNAAVAETTDGTRYQHKPGSHNPFIPLPEPSKSTASAAKSSASSTTSSTSSAAKSESKSSSSAPSGGGGTTPSKPSTSTPTKPKQVHKFIAEVGVLFGPVAAPGAPSQLIPYAGIKRREGLPAGKTPLIVFAGLGADRKSAIFTLSREAILKGSATCLPSTTQCEAIELQAGQSEELSYVEPTGTTLTYGLALQSIDWHETTVTATTSRRHRRHHHHG